MLPWYSHGMQILNIMFPTRTLIVFSLSIKGWFWQCSAQLRHREREGEREGEGITIASLANMQVQCAVLSVFLALCCVGSCRLTGRAGEVWVNSGYI